MFEKYQHVERLNSPETDGLLDGICYVFPKIDGTNASVWTEIDDDGYDVCCGSRNRELSLDADNAGFMGWVFSDGNHVMNLAIGHHKLRFFGEWLVPHSLKTYRDEAWRDFYIFDVMREDGTYMPYDDYKPILDEFGINYIPPLAVIKKPSGDDLLKILDRSGEFLVKDGAGKGEGIVVKNYGFVNKYGRTTWGKMVTNEFKEIHNKEMGAPLVNGTLLVEEQIVRDFLTDKFIEKERAKIILQNTQIKVGYGQIIIPAEWQPRMIPELLGRVWYEFIREETPNFVKKYKNPKVDFNLLQKMVQKETKRVIGL